MVSNSMNAADPTEIWDFHKLRGRDNYHVWSEKMKSALKYSRLWDVVEQGHALLSDDSSGKQTVQEQQQDGTVTVRVIVPIPEQVLTYESSLKEWKKLNNQAAELIYTMCEDQPAESIEDVDGAMNRWTKLESDYMDSGFVLRFTKLQELWNTTLLSCNGSIQTYVANIRTKSEELKRMGAGIDEWILVSLLLNNLGIKYKDFVHRQLTQSIDPPDFDKVVTLLHEEDRLKRDNKEQAMAAASRNFKKKKEEKKNSRDTTWYQ
ncbi:hypothetical protein IMSHALPRED_003053 [Imshaugia aleurites]|uniref:DUF4219 domain-containing protein n=1 Tax=Imshaugia aleurites TaxID=172621 RepID=A0A8H3I660_9LECA|nr:hypothetical protein IMSHALPRED_003053 [Imshaugia aleurites]